MGSGESFANDDEDIMEEQDKEEDWEDVEEWDQDYPVTRSICFAFIILTIEFLACTEGSRNLSPSVSGRYCTGQLWKLFLITQPLVLCGR